MVKNHGHRSIQNKILFTFTLVLIISVLSIGSIMLVRWYRTSIRTLNLIESTISMQVHEAVRTFLDKPMHLNEIGQRILSYDLFQITDATARDKFFVGALLASDPAIYSYSYGTEAGHYYGARRNAQGVVEIMRNDETTQGHSHYFSVDEKLLAHEMVVDVGLFDPRSRAWYQAAKTQAKPTFSPLYKHFVMDDLTLSTSWPVYAEDGSLKGVLGSHMLLGSLGGYLKDVIEPYQGYALIVEKGNGLLVGNSLGLANFTEDGEGQVRRTHVSDVSITALYESYLSYLQGKSGRLLDTEQDGQTYFTTEALDLEGVDWLLISAVPHTLLFSSFYSSISITLVVVALALLLSVVSYRLLTKRMLRPLTTLLEVANAITNGDLDRRVPIMRNDEIGLISEHMNRVADKMLYLINNLEKSVFIRTKALQEANEQLQESQSQLRLLLDSTAEGIYGMDLEGRCTVVNTSALRMLGYDSEQQLLGKEIHTLIHHSHPDGSEYPSNECPILKALTTKSRIQVEDEQFFRSDGSPFSVAYHAYPQLRETRVIGGVVSFMDITKRKQREEEIAYLSSHDALTGVHNRRFFEVRYQTLNSQEHYPLSVIFADINGLKLTNDVFGHSAGDQLILQSARILKSCCRPGDLVARIGGDEFAILLPVSDEATVLHVIDAINRGFSDAIVEAVKCSIALGYDIQTDGQKALEELMANAENMMYKQKTTNRHSVNEGILHTLVETLYTRSPKERAHAQMVTDLCVRFTQFLQLPSTQIRRLEKAAYLHDIGKITLPADLLEKTPLQDDEYDQMRQHPVIGFRILNLFDETLDLAPYVYSHHERWDGSGYPRGLKGSEIPQTARILSIIEAFERIMGRNTSSDDRGVGKGISEIRKGAGTQFDPELAEAFATMMESS